MKRFFSQCTCFLLLGFCTAAWAQDEKHDETLESVAAAVQEVVPEGTVVRIVPEGEQSVVVQGESTASAPPSGSANAAQDPNASQDLNAPQPRVMRKRELKNREFDDCEKIRLLMCAHCEFPSKEDFVSTGRDPETCIKAVIADESELISVRERALTALAYFDSSENRASLKQTLENADTTEDRFFVIYSIVAYSQIAQEESVPLVSRFMAHGDDFVRLTAIRRLGETPGNAAYTALKKQYQIEENRFFKQKLEDALAAHCKRNRSLCR